MDTTPIYKTQCKAAFEDIGFVFNEGPQNLLIVDNDELLFSTSTKKETIDFNEATMFSIHGQLYRQDQLQGLVDEPLSAKIVKFLVWISNRFNRIWEESEIYELTGIGSMEQLWLAFVMHQKFKTWDSDKEQWVREG